MWQCILTQFSMRCTFWNRGEHRTASCRQDSAKNRKRKSWEEWGSSLVSSFHICSLCSGWRCLSAPCHLFPLSSRLDFRTSDFVLGASQNRRYSILGRLVVWFSPFIQICQKVEGKVGWSRIVTYNAGSRNLFFDFIICRSVSQHMSTCLRYEAKLWRNSAREI